jgi:hypothetical protein
MRYVDVQKVHHTAKRSKKELARQQKASARQFKSGGSANGSSKPSAKMRGGKV